MPVINIDAYVSISTDDAAVARYKRWKKAHEYGPYTLRLAPTGVNTSIVMVHSETGSEVDLTDYENI